MWAVTSFFHVFEAVIVWFLDCLCHVLFQTHVNHWEFETSPPTEGICFHSPLLWGLNKQSFCGSDDLITLIDNTHMRSLRNTDLILSSPKTGSSWALFQLLPLRSRHACGCETERKREMWGVDSMESPELRRPKSPCSWESDEWSQYNNIRLFFPVWPTVPFTELDWDEKRLKIFLKQHLKFLIKQEGDSEFVGDYFQQWINPHFGSVEYLGQHHNIIVWRIESE